MTRRIEGGARFQEMADCVGEILYNEGDGTLDMKYEGLDIFSHKCRYKVGEVVAVAQNYEQVYRQGNMDADADLKYDPGMSNKMYVRADLMPHRIRITNIRCERLQEISDEDCLREGVMEHTYLGYVVDGIIYKGHKDDEYNGAAMIFHTPREAFASLIDKVSGRGTWARNPWVVVYEFELIK